MPHSVTCLPDWKDHRIWYYAYGVLWVLATALWYFGLYCFMGSWSRPNITKKIKRSTVCSPSMINTRIKPACFMCVSQWFNAWLISRSRRYTLWKLADLTVGTLSFSMKRQSERPHLKISITAVFCFNLERFWSSQASVTRLTIEPLFLPTLHSTVSTVAVSFVKLEFNLI